MGEWWRELFEGLWAEHRLSEPKPSAMVAWEAAAIDRLLAPPHGLAPGSRLLDIPSGDGALSLALAARGHQAHGLDREPLLVATSQRRATASHLQACFIVGDMRSLPYDGTFDGVLCYAGSFGYFGDRGDTSFLHQVRRALRPGGRFLLEVATVETLLPRFRPRCVTVIPGGWVEELSRFDPVSSRIESRWTMVRWGTHRVVESAVRLYSSREIVELLVHCGFSLPRLCGSLGGEPFLPTSPRLVAITTARPSEFGTPEENAR